MFSSCPEFVSDLLPATDALYNLGSMDKKWKNAYLSGELHFPLSSTAHFFFALDEGGGYPVLSLMDAVSSSVLMTWYVVGGIPQISWSGNIASDMIPNQTDTLNLGLSTNRWIKTYTRDLSLDTTDGHGLLTDVKPNIDNLRSLGSSARRWLDAFFTRYILTGKVTSLPTADATYRGKMIRVEGGAGVADKLYVCMKSASDAYSWVQVASG